MRTTTERPTAALVTGASSGIGRATALLLAHEGLHVVLTGRAPDVLKLLAEEILDAGGTASVEQLDVRDADAVHRVVAQAADEFGRGLAVVHSAAVVAYGNVEEVPADVMTDVVNTNVFGTIAVCRAAMDAFRRTGGGHLVVIGSLLGEIATPYMSSYVLSKWAVHGLVRTLQIEARQREGVAISLIAPGGIDTPIYQQAATVLGRHGNPPPPVLEPEDVARRVWWVLRHPRRQTNVGPANLVTIAGFRLFPAVYDALVTPLMRTFGLAPWRDCRRPPATSTPPSTPHPRRTPCPRTTPCPAPESPVGGRARRGRLGGPRRRLAVRHLGGRRLPRARGRPGLARGRHEAAPQLRPVAGRHLRLDGLGGGGGAAPPGPAGQGLAGG